MGKRAVRIRSVDLRISIERRKSIIEGCKGPKRARSYDFGACNCLPHMPLRVVRDVGNQPCHGCRQLLFAPPPWRAEIHGLQGSQPLLALLQGVRKLCEYFLMCARWLMLGAQFCQLLLFQRRALGVREQSIEASGDMFQM